MLADVRDQDSMSLASAIGIIISTAGSVVRSGRTRKYVRRIYSRIVRPAKINYCTRYVPEVQLKTDDKQAVPVAVLERKEKLQKDATITAATEMLRFPRRIWISLR